MRFVDVSVLVAVIGGLLFLTSCTGGENTGGAVPGVRGGTPTARLDDTRFLGEPLTVANLTVWPVFTEKPLDIGEFLTLEEAQAAGIATVRELGGAAVQQDARSRGNGVAQEDVEPAAPQQERVAQQLDNGVGAQSGQAAEVGRLVVENNGEKPLLICAGTVVKGGNQDRQIGQDVVVAAGESIDVDAFCVEAGRWTNVREGVANDGTFEVAKSMAPAKVRTKGQYLKDQQEVWSEVAVARQVASVQTSLGNGLPQGSTLVDALEKVDGEAAQKRLALRDRVAAHLRALGDAVGFAYAVNGQPVTVRAFAHSRLLDKHLDAFAETMAIEALGAEETDFEPPRAADVVAMVREINAAAEKMEQTRGANMNGVRLAENGFNSNCYFDLDGQKLPLTQDWTKK